MARNIEDPVTTARDGVGGRGETVTTHPAFAQIGVSRVSGHTNLYDSDFAHNAYMMVRIFPSELVRGLSYDRHHAGRLSYIEVALSEAQWATFVSSANIGDGVPCTLERKDGTGIPGLPSPPSRQKQFKSEMADDIADTLKAVSEMEALIDSMGLPKGKAQQLLNKAMTVRNKLTSSLPFVADQFDEHMEGIVERSKAEVHGYMTGQIMRSGLAALGGVEPLQIEDARS